MADVLVVNAGFVSLIVSVIMSDAFRQGILEGSEKGIAREKLGCARVETRSPSQDESEQLPSATERVRVPEVTPEGGRSNPQLNPGTLPGFRSKTKNLPVVKHVIDEGTDHPTSTNIFSVTSSTASRALEPIPIDQVRQNSRYQFPDKAAQKGPTPSRTRDIRLKFDHMVVFSFSEDPKVLRPM